MASFDSEPVLVQLTVGAESRYAVMSRNRVTACEHTSYTGQANFNEAELSSIFFVPLSMGLYLDDLERIEISNTGRRSVRALAFTADGKHIVSGDDSRCVRVWRVEDGKEMATMEAGYSTTCLAISKDGKWIVAGSLLQDRVFLLDAKTFKRVSDHQERDSILGVDFSPDSTTLLVASGKTTTVLDVASLWRIRLGPLHHETWVRAAKYSPTGDRIATATMYSVRVWDGNHSGQLLVEFKIEVTPLYNKGLLWGDHNHLFAVCRNQIKMFETSKDSNTSEWHVPYEASDLSCTCIALPRNSEFIACSTNRTVTFWDIWTNTQLAYIEKFEEDICSITHSPDDQFIAISGVNGKIVVVALSRINLRLCCLFRDLDIPIDGVILDFLKHGQLAEAGASLTAAILTSHDTSHHVLACRALVRTRLRQWNAAILDAKESIGIQPSVMGYISMSIALAGKGEKHKAYQTCDLAFQHHHSTRVQFLLLVKAIIVFMAGEHEDAISRMDDLISVVHFNSVYSVVQAYMHILIGNSRMKSRDYDGAIKSLECAQTRLINFAEDDLITITSIFGWKFDGLGIMVQQRLCEALYAAGRVKDAAELLLEMIHSSNEELYTRQPLAEWVSSFTHQYFSISHWGDNAVSETDRVDHKALEPHTTLDPVTRKKLLREWAESTLTFRSWKDTLISSSPFTVQRFLVYRAVCEHLETVRQIMEASECFCQMANELAEEINEQTKWALQFKQRCYLQLVYLGDAAASAERDSDAIAPYSAALALNPVAPQAILIKRSKAHLVRGSWEKSLDDAEKVITLDPLSPWGYERKHAALHQAGEHNKAIDAFETMLLIMSQSPDLHIRDHLRNYVTPMEIVTAIQKTVQDAIQDSPRVLINTISGRLCDKSEQAAAFESLPIFKQLISSMTTHIDQARIEDAVREYYRYATFSHKWDEGEPLFEKVVHIVVYDLEESLTHDKLQMFCKIVRDSGFNWAWSDTCCINKADHFVLQEAIVAMFKWYEGSALTVIFLRGVRSPSQRGDLTKSVWNSRAWTFQEYHASKVVRFYTEDWKLYMDVDIPNHKECPEIMSEMEEVTGISAQVLMSLRPGLDDIRTKLCLASQRKTTLVEDAAYSLLGMFSISLPVVYGEGEKALGRLLGQLLASSGDTSILAWTGRSGSFNSCLPVGVSAFSTLPTTHIPPALSGTETNTITAGPNPTLVMQLYDRLVDLPVPSLAGRRIKLPCITFKLGPVAASLDRPEQVFRAQTAALGVVEIKTNENLSKFNTLYLIHPWIDFLLDRQPVGSVLESIAEESEDVDDPSSSMGALLSSPGPAVAPPAPKISRAARFAARLGLPLNGQSTSSPLFRDRSSLRPPSSMSGAEKQIRACRAIARLRRPFGALLLTPTLDGVAAYKRIATESLITVQVAEEMTPTVLNKLVEGVRILDVL